MALGTLAKSGPAHGHQIRSLAEVTGVEEWGGVSVGALYRELRAMESEGLIAVVRTEQVGRRPARTIYEITSEGRFYLVALAVNAIRTTTNGCDPVSVALTFAFDAIDRESMREAMTARRDRLAISLRELTAKREQGRASGYLTPVDAVSIRRGELHIETEIRWHEELDELLAEKPVDNFEILLNSIARTEGFYIWRSSRRVALRAHSAAESEPWRRSAAST
jgi:DNA-binding PadR family transcriptional regulator